MSEDSDLSPWPWWRDYAAGDVLGVWSMALVLWEAEATALAFGLTIGILLYVVIREFGRRRQR